VTEGETAWPPSDVLVTVQHPFGEVECTLTQWIERGPGRRPLVRPVAARSAATGEALPLTVIPLRYRNDEQSRALIAAGELEPPPWHTAREK
jgi:hypothetical protein